MSHLLREHAPITEESWGRARRGGARAPDARRWPRASSSTSPGPHGWQHSATNLGRTDGARRRPSTAWPAGSAACCRSSRCAPAFAVSRAELADADRGAEDTDFAELDRAAHDLAAAENAAVFHGWKAAGIVGIAEASPYKAIALGNDCERYPRHVAMAVEQLLAAGIDGPYGLALGPGAHALVLESSEHGGCSCSTTCARSSAARSCGRPGVDGAVVISLRGGDFLFESGEDISVGYLSHDADAVHLYLEESFSFRSQRPRRRSR